MMRLSDFHPPHFDGSPALPAAPPRPRRWWRWVAAGGVLVAAAGVGFDRLRGHPPTPSAVSPGESGSAAPEVKTVRPVRQTVRKTIEQPGRVEGYEQTPIQVKIPGFVAKWTADIGQRVAAGDVLAELSVPEEQEELKRREATVALSAAEVTAAEKTLDAAKADEVKAEAMIRQAEATKSRVDANVIRWKAEFRRQTEARGSGATSQSDFDITQDQLRTAEAGVKEAEAMIDSATAAKVSAVAARLKADAGVTVAKAKRDVAAADARRQAEWLKYAIVRAPFAGVVSQRNVDTGQYVTPPGAGGTPALPLFVVVRTDPVRVFVDVPETEAALVAEKMPATVRIQAQGDREIAGTVTRFSWALDQNTRTLRVQIDLPNPDGLLRPGMFATARLIIDRPGAWLVPAGVVVTTDEQPYAVRVEGGKSVKTPVKLGARQGGLVELLHKQTRTVPRGEPLPWEPLTGTEELLTARPAGWTDGSLVSQVR
ncbi:MAG: putative efflux rane fusion protein [Gemmataceae bacterium]|nr:putative efflux rane fusion protein [Gemmataceae bacterium]